MLAGPSSHPQGDPPQHCGCSTRPRSYILSGMCAPWSTAASVSTASASISCALPVLTCISVNVGVPPPCPALLYAWCGGGGGGLRAAPFINTCRGAGPGPPLWIGTCASCTKPRRVSEHIFFGGGAFSCSKSHVGWRVAIAPTPEGHHRAPSYISALCAA
jgi:hypothetical protein